VLSADSTGRSVECRGDSAQTVVQLKQAGHGHAFFGLELLVVAGSGGHLLALRGLQVLHFTFESARSWFIFANKCLKSTLIFFKITWVRLQMSSGSCCTGH
jgi:hypothetical protein